MTGQQAIPVLHYKSKTDTQVPRTHKKEGCNESR